MTWAAFHISLGLLSFAAFSFSFYKGLATAAIANSFFFIANFMFAGHLIGKML